MAFRTGNRYQTSLFPQSIEEYVEDKDPVRAYDMFVDSIDIKALGFKLDSRRVGNSSYDPIAMIKLLVYGYSYGIKSSRKLEQACYHNVSFIWLVGGLRPDHKTISEFRRNNKSALKQILRQCAQLCIRLNLIAGNILFVDGTKIRANAGRDKTRDRRYHEKQLRLLDKRIEELLNDCDKVDQQEKQQDSYVAMDKELAKSKALKSKITRALKTMDPTQEKVNITDPDCSIMRSIQGSHASYNVQSVVDEENGLIVQAEAVSENNDRKQFSSQIEKANDVLKKPCEIACADAGYANTKELEEVDSQGIKVIVPTQRQALQKKESQFSKSNFTYDKKNNCYHCPEGHKLKYRSTDKSTGKLAYKITNKDLCLNCVHYGSCTKSKSGRKIVRLANENVKLKIEAIYEEKESQLVYAKRKTKVELPFGHIKRNLKTDAFHLRGLVGVQAETSILATCFNIRRMITLLGGTSGFVETLKRFNLATTPS